MLDNKISRKSKIKVKWNCLSHVYSKDAEKQIINAFSKQYNLPKDRIKVEPNVVVVDNEGNEISVKTEVIDNIHDPKFQQKLFQEYISMNEIKNINQKQLYEIDDEINQEIDYNQYESFNKISIKWIEVKNFMSFGSDITRLDFTELNGLILINGIPSNQAGKSVLTGDAVKYLLYGKTNRTKSNDQIFNRFLENETEVIIRGCIAVNGDEYVIERKLNRPKKRTKTSKATGTVQYFKVIDKLWDPEKPLEDYDSETFDNKSGDVRNTNKIIKESLMKEEDFNLISTANSKTLDALIDTGEAGLSKLFSRWIGLSVIEDKEVVAKAKYKEKSKTFLCNQYSTDQLQDANIELKDKIDGGEKTISELNSKLQAQTTIIDEYHKSKEVLIASKGKVDEKLIKMDFPTQEKRRDEIKEAGQNLRLQEKEYQSKIDALKDVVITIDKKVIENNRQIISDTNNQFNKNTGDIKLKYNQNISDIKLEYNTRIANEKKTANDAILPLVSDIATIKANFNQLKEENKKLDGSRECPTCKRPYDAHVLDDINRTIQSNNEKMEKLKQSGIVKNQTKENIEKNCAETVTKLEIELNSKVEELEKELKTKVEQLERTHKDVIDKLTKQNQELINQLDSETKQIDERNKWELKLSQTKVDVQKSINDYKEVDQLIKDYLDNKESIRKNMDLDVQVNNINIRIQTEQRIKEDIIKDLSKEQQNMSNWGSQIKTNDELIGKLYIENEYIKHYQLLINLLSKDGIKKLVLRNVIPLINSNLNNLLSGVDFNVELEIDEKNNLSFLLYKENSNGEFEYGELKTASGYERTMSSLAIRSILYKMGSTPMLSLCVLDEIIATVSETNFDNLYDLLKKIADDYDTLFVISHSSQFNQYFDRIITIVKENNVSKIEKQN